MSNAKKLISSLGELYKKILHQESIEDTNSMDFYLDVLEEQAGANRKRMQELGQLTEVG